MPNQQKYRPISFRPPEADRARLLQHAAKTGEPVNAILAKALTEYLDRLQDAQHCGRGCPDMDPAFNRGAALTAPRQAASLTGSTAGTKKAADADPS